MWRFISTALLVCVVASCASAPAFARKHVSTQDVGAYHVVTQYCGDRACGVVNSKETRKRVRSARGKHHGHRYAHKRHRGSERRTVNYERRGGTPIELAQRAFDRFVDMGYSSVAAAGLVGNIKAESNFNVHDVGDGGRARGLAQWHPDRFAVCKRLARDRGSDVHAFDLQLDCIDHELRTNETYAYQELKRARTVEQATAAVVHYERPSGWSQARPQRAHNFHGRLSFARFAHDRFGGRAYAGQTP